MYAIVSWPCDSLGSLWFCYASGFGVIFDGDTIKPSELWSSDSLDGVFQPGAELHELTGEQPLELVLQGLIGLSANWGGEIMSCDGGVIRLISPAIHGEYGDRFSGLNAERWFFQSSRDSTREEMVIYPSVPGSERGKRQSVPGLLRYDPDSGAMRMMSSDSTHPHE